MDSNKDSVIRVGIYNRCSTEEEVQINALATQVAESAEIAERKGWLVVEQYVELESGTSIKGRVEYQRLLEDLECDKFDVIMIKSIDRLMRSTKDWYIFIDKVITYNKRLFIYMDNKFYEPDDALITGIKAILAEEFSRELSKKIKNAHRRRQEKKSGYNFTGPTFGWNKISQTEFEINEEEAYYYRLAFVMLREGKGFHAIAKYMAKEGVVNRRTGKNMSETQWRNMLYAPRAHGEVILHQTEYDFNTKKRIKLPEEEWIRIEGALPAIVSKEYHELVLDEYRQRIMTNKKTGAKKEFFNRGHYLLSGKIICGCCGAVYYCNTDIRNRKKTWRCANKTYYGRDRCKSVNVFDEIVIAIVEKACGDYYAKLFGTNEDGVIEDTLKVVKKMMDNNTDGQVLKKLKKELGEQERKKEILFQKLINEIISDEDFKMVKKGIDKKIEELQSKINRRENDINPNTNREERIKIIRMEMKAGQVVHKAETRLLFDKIERIIVYPDKQLEIVFKKTSLLAMCAIDRISLDIKDEDFFRIKVPYIYVKKCEIERERNNQRICEVLNDNPYMNLAGVADVLGLTQSYIHTSVKQLKEQGKLFYKRPGEWIVVEEKQHKIP